jgi:hypothetical protein
MSAVKDYRRANRIADEMLSEQYATTLHVAGTSRELADAAIAELEAENERLKNYGTSLALSGLGFKQRAEQAETELEHANELCIRDLDVTEKRAEQAEAELTALKKQMDQCIWMIHTGAQEYMTGSRAVMSWTDYIRELESRWEARP